MSMNHLFDYSVDEMLDVGGPQDEAQPREDVPTERGLDVRAFTSWDAVLAKTLLKAVDFDKLAQFNSIGFTIEEIRSLIGSFQPSMTSLDKTQISDMEKVRDLSLHPETIAAILGSSTSKPALVYEAHFHFWCIANKYIKMEIDEKGKLIFRYQDFIYHVPDEGHVDEKQARTFLTLVGTSTGKVHDLIKCGRNLCDAAYAFSHHVRVVGSKSSLNSMEGSYSAPYMSIPLPELVEVNKKMSSYIAQLKSLVGLATHKPAPTLHPVQWFCQLILDNELESKVPPYPFKKPSGFLAKVPYSQSLANADNTPVRLSPSAVTAIVQNFDNTLANGRKYRIPMRWNAYSHDWATPAHTLGNADSVSSAMKVAEAVIKLRVDKVWKDSDPVVVVGDPKHFQPIIDGLGLTPSSKVNIGHGYKPMVGWEPLPITTYDSDELSELLVKRSKGAWVVQMATMSTSEVANVKGSDYLANRAIHARIKKATASKGFLLQVFVEKAFLSHGFSDLKDFLDLYQGANVFRPWRQHNADFVFAFYNTNVQRTVDSGSYFAALMRKVAMLCVVCRRYGDIRNLAMALGLPGLPFESEGSVLSPSFGEYPEEVKACFQNCLKMLPTATIGKQKSVLAPEPKATYVDQFENFQVSLDFSIPKSAASLKPRPPSAPASLSPSPAASEAESEEGELVDQRKKTPRETIAKKKALGPLIAPAAVATATPPPLSRPSPPTETAPKKKTTPPKSREVTPPPDLEKEKEPREKPESEESDRETQKTRSKRPRRKARG